MVKGISRQVIVVKSPDPKLFEQAIFILREDALGNQGVTDEEILRQARQAANGYLAQRRRGKRPVPKGLYALAGAVSTGLIWILTVLL